MPRITGKVSTMRATRVTQRRSNFRLSVWAVRLTGSAPKSAAPKKKMCTGGPPRRLYGRHRPVIPTMDGTDVPQEFNSVRTGRPSNALFGQPITAAAPHARGAQVVRG